MATLSGPHRLPLSGGAPDSLVVMLHGRGSNGNDLIGLADVFAPAFPNTVFHSPNAPLDLEGMPGYHQWYELSNRESRGEGVRAVEPTVNAFIDELLTEYGLEASRCIQLGFSQGCITSMHTVPRRRTPLAGVVGFSGQMVTGDSLLREVASKTPFILIHGAEDERLPASGSVEAAAKFEEAGIAASSHVLPGLGHSLDARGFVLAGIFMQQVLA